MSFKLYHQCGHNSNWNIESFRDDMCGDGLIFSPVHTSKKKIESEAPELKAQSLFDPQFYLPNSQKKKLQNYDFFPETISGGFSTIDFQSLAHESAEKCVQFQIENEFEKIIIPARHFDQMLPDYCEKQDSYTVHPFLHAVETANINKKILITLPVTSAMLNHPQYRTGLLNWITSNPEIDGVYLLVENISSTKQICDDEFLANYLLTVKELTNVGLEVLVGHCNTEGLLFSLVNNCDITFGTYENTRNFSVDKFIVTDEEKRGPRARVYIPKLLNWILWSDAVNIMSTSQELWNLIYEPTKYSERIMSATSEPHFGTPQLYKHHFCAYQRQVDELRGIEIPDRFKHLMHMTKTAQDIYNEIKKSGLTIDKHGQGEHLRAWSSAIEKIA